MTAEWTEATSEVVRIAQELILNHHAHLRDANIGFLFRSEASSSKGRLVLGQAMKLPDKMHAYLDYDFIIWLAEDEYIKLDTTRRTALIDHQLCHCGGEREKWVISGHDIEEFNQILTRYGTWQNDLLKAEYALETWKQTRSNLNLIGTYEESVLGLVRLCSMGAEAMLRVAELEAALEANALTPKANISSYEPILYGAIDRPAPTTKPPIIDPIHIPSRTDGKPS